MARSAGGASVCVAFRVDLCRYVSRRGRMVTGMYTTRARNPENLPQNVKLLVTHCGNSQKWSCVMFVETILRGRPFASFLRDRRAGVAPMFALALVPIVGFVGAAIDYSRANSVKVAMQAAVDATAL